MMGEPSWPIVTELYSPTLSQSSTRVRTASEQMRSTQCAKARWLERAKLMTGNPSTPMVMKGWTVLVPESRVELVVAVQSISSQ